jgi:hypothetical protein
MAAIFTRDVAVGTTCLSDLLQHCNWVWSRPLLFAIRTIEKRKILSCVVFMNSRMAKAHDSLPPCLFSPTAFSANLHYGYEFIISPWYLSTVRLTVRNSSTVVRAAFPEIGLCESYVTII